MPKSASADTKQSTIVSHASCRVDLAGSTLDLWPLYLFHAGAITLNFAVNILTRCQITRLPTPEIRLKSIDTGREDAFSGFAEFCTAKRYNHGLAAYLIRYFFPVDCDLKQGFSIETNSESPAGAGISGSSALMVSTAAALACLTRRKLSREELRVIAQNIEAQLIRVPTGCQDYYPALYGGVNAIHLDPDGIHREAINVAPEEIESRFVLVYTGAQRNSGINNWEVFKAHINGDKRILKNFDQISEIARQMHDALRAANWEEVARLLQEEWRLRKTNVPGISTPLMEKLIKVAQKNGARAAKVCGAGGGGCFVLLVDQGQTQQIAYAIRQEGGTVLPFRVSMDGVTTTGRSWLSQDLACR